MLYRGWGKEEKKKGGGKFAEIHDTARGKSLDTLTFGYVVEVQVHPFFPQ